MLYTQSGTRDTGRSLAKHRQTATRVKKSYPNGIRVLGHHTGREAVEGPRTGTEETEKNLR